MINRLGPRRWARVARSSASQASWAWTCRRRPGRCGSWATSSWAPTTPSSTPRPARSASALRPRPERARCRPAPAWALCWRVRRLLAERQWATVSRRRGELETCAALSSKRTLPAPSPAFWAGTGVPMHFFLACGCPELMGGPAEEADSGCIAGCGAELSACISVPLCPCIITVLTRCTTLQSLYTSQDECFGIQVTMFELPVGSSNKATHAPWRRRR